MRLALSMPNLTIGSFFSGLVMHPGISKYSASVKVVLIHPSITLEFNLDGSYGLEVSGLIAKLGPVAAVDGLNGLIDPFFIIPVLGFRPDFILRTMSSGLL